MTWLIALHASAATLALVLGGYNLARSVRGDRTHRRIGRIWVLAMYWTVLSSFWIRELTPGQFSWIHGLSLFTLVTLTIGLWAAISGRTAMHRRFITGSYLGLIGAFIGAVAVPSRHIPQLALHQPLVLALSAAVLLLIAALVVRLARARPQRARSRRRQVPEPSSGLPAAGTRVE
jgi:uncharacterized membrane protein